MRGLVEEFPIPEAKEIHSVAIGAHERVIDLVALHVHRRLEKLRMVIYVDVEN